MYKQATTACVLECISVLNKGYVIRCIKDTLYVVDREVLVLLFKGFLVQGFDIYAHIFLVPEKLSVYHIVVRKTIRSLYGRVSHRPENMYI